MISEVKVFRSQACVLYNFTLIQYMEYYDDLQLFTLPFCVFPLVVED